MFRLLVASVIASTGLIISTVEAGNHASEQLDRMISDQLESFTSTGSSTSVNGHSSPAMLMPPPNPIIKAPAPHKPMNICWVVDKETICIGGE